MDAREGSVRQLGGDDAITTRMGAVALFLSVPVLVVAELFHPSREDPMDNVALFIYGLAIALGSVYTGWAGLIAAVSGVALMYNGVIEVAYEGFVPSIVKLVGLALLALWALAMAFLMWRNGSGRRIARLASTPTYPTQRPTRPR